MDTLCRFQFQSSVCSAFLVFAGFASSRDVCAVMRNGRLRWLVPIIVKRAAVTYVLDRFIVPSMVRTDVGARKISAMFSLRIPAHRIERKPISAFL